MPVPTPPPLSRTLPIPQPWDLEHFRAALEARQGRPLLFEAAPLPQGCAALRATTDAADLIIYNQALDSPGSCTPSGTSSLTCFWAIKAKTTASPCFRTWTRH